MKNRPVNGSGVLLLNQTYEILNIVSIKRAFKLFFNNKVYFEEVSTETISSAYKSHSVPTVIRLREYIYIKRNIKYNESKKSKIFIRDKYTCSYCCKRFLKKDLTVDHIMPKSLGGSNDPSNLATSCVPCNQKKGNRTPMEANMVLKTNYSKNLEAFVPIHYSHQRPEWKKYFYLD